MYYYYYIKISIYWPMWIIINNHNYNTGYKCNKNVFSDSNTTFDSQCIFIDKIVGSNLCK